MQIGFVHVFFGSISGSPGEGQREKNHCQHGSSGVEPPVGREAGEGSGSCGEASLKRSLDFGS